MCAPVPSRPSPIPEPCYIHIQDKSRRDLKLFCVLPLGLRGLQTLAELGRDLCGENTAEGPEGSVWQRDKQSLASC